MDDQCVLPLIVMSALCCGNPGGERCQTEACVCMCVSVRISDMMLLGEVVVVDGGGVVFQPVPGL